MIRANNLVGLCTALFVATALLPVNAATVSWVGGSGDWNTAANWSSGALPTTNDDVVINPASTSVTVTHASGIHAVKSLASQRAFSLTGGSLTVSNTVQVNNTFTLAGGTLVKATVLAATNGNIFIVSGSGTADGVTLNGVVDVGSTYSGANLTVLNGLTLNGTALVGNASNGSYGALSFAGSQTLSGNGTVVFCHITQNWRGKPLTSHEVVVNLIGSTTTRTGLKIKAELYIAT